MPGFLSCNLLYGYRVCVRNPVLPVLRPVTRYETPQLGFVEYGPSILSCSLWSVEKKKQLPPYTLPSLLPGHFSGRKCRHRRYWPQERTGSGGSCLPVVSQSSKGGGEGRGPWVPSSEDLKESFLKLAEPSSPSDMLPISLAFRISLPSGCWQGRGGEGPAQHPPAAAATLVGGWVA